MSPVDPIYRASSFKDETSPIPWQQALAGLPKAHALQSWAWGEFKSRWGWSAQRLSFTVAENSWQPLATAQVLKRRLPNLPYCMLYVPKGPALNYNDPELRSRVLAALEKLARQEKAIFIKIDPEVVYAWGVEQERKSPVGKQVIRDLQQRGWQSVAGAGAVSQHGRTGPDPLEEDLLAAMKSKTRYNIRLAGRKDITVRPGTPADFPIIAEMYAETAARDGFTIRPIAYYLDAWQTLYDAGHGHAADRRIRRRYR